MELIGFILLVTVPVGIFWMWFQEMFSKALRLFMTSLYLLVFLGVLFLGYKADNTPLPPVEPMDVTTPQVDVEEPQVNGEVPVEVDEPEANVTEKAEPPAKAVEKELAERAEIQDGRQLDFETSMNVIKLYEKYDQFQKNPQASMTETNMAELDMLLREVEGKIEELETSAYFAEELKKGDVMKTKFDFYDDTYNVMNTIHEAVMNGDQAKMDEAKILSQDMVNSQVAFLELAKQVKEETDALKSQP